LKVNETLNVSSSNIFVILMCVFLLSIFIFKDYQPIADLLQIYSWSSWPIADYCFCKYLCNPRK